MDNMLHVMRHALGLNQYGEGVSYRNHFVAGGVNLETCRDGVAQGFMKEHASSELSGGSPWFSVTRAGIEHIAVASPRRPPEAKLTRSAIAATANTVTCSTPSWPSAAGTQNPPAAGTEPVRYRLQHEDGRLVENHPGFNSKADAETWFQEHLALLGGLDWRVGFLVKAKRDIPLRLVWSKTLKPVA